MYSITYIEGRGDLPFSQTALNPLTGGTRPNFSRNARMAVLVLNHDLNNHTQLVLE